MPVSQARALLGILFFISPLVGSCTRERTRPSFDPDLALLEIAKSLCAAPRTALQQYLADERRRTAWLHDSMRAALPDTFLSRLDSTLAEGLRRGS